MTTQPATLPKEVFLPEALQKLPMANYLATLRAALKNNQILLVTGETGSGKSTAVFGIMDKYQIFSGQPRVLAAQGLAGFLSSLLNQEVGNTIGYNTGFHKKYTSDGRILFLTHGMMFEQEAYASEIPDREDVVVVIDECHMQSADMEALIAMLLTRIKNGAKFKLVFMSATVGIKRIQSAVQASLRIEEAPHIHIGQRLYSVDVRNIKPEQMLSTAISHAKNGENVLIFLPTVKEINKFCARLNGRVNAEIVPLYAQLSEEEKARALRCDYGRPKIVVATNIAESSITIPDIDVVIESGIECHGSVDREGNLCLVKGYKSQANVRQAIGRAGRTKPGTAYIVFPTIEDRLPYPPTAVNSEPFARILLKLAYMDVHHRDFLWLQEPNANLCFIAQQQLLDLGALMRDTDGHCTITSLGQEMASYPLKPYLARMVCEAKKLGIYDFALLAAAVASNRKPLFEPYHYKYGEWQQQEECSFWLMAQVFLDLYAEMERQELKGTDRDLWLESEGIAVNAYNGIEELYFLLCERANVTPYALEVFIDDLESKKVFIRSLITGLWPFGIYKAGVLPPKGNCPPKKVYFHATKKTFLISRGASSPNAGSLAMGTPFIFTDDVEEFSKRTLENQCIITEHMIREALPTEIAERIIEEARETPLPSSEKRGSNKGKTQAKKRGPKGGKPGGGRKRRRR